MTLVPNTTLKVGRLAQTSNDATDYYLGDALGSARQLTDDDAKVTLSQSYSPYGEVIENSGEAETNYGFTGEWTDGTGLINLRARYYDPGTGRFISADTWDGDYLNPLSLNKWNYTNGNPIKYSDPTGHCISGAIVDTVFCIFVVSLAAGAVIDATNNAVTQYNDTGHIDWDEVIGHSLEGASIAGAPFMVLIVAPEALSATGYGIWSIGDAVNSATISNAGVKIFSSSSALNEFLSTQLTNGVPIPERELTNFDQGKANLTIFKEGDTLYRVHSPDTAIRNWWSTIPPEGELQWRIDQAVNPEWGNTATNLSTLKVPSGCLLFGASGPAAYQGGFYVGGGNQVYLPSVPKSWVTTMEFLNKLNKIY